MRQPDYPDADATKWAAVDDYFSERLAPVDVALQAALASSRAAGMPVHEVSSVQGKFLALLVRMTQARRVLEIGTLGGYSTICIARALPEGGKIVTIERNPDYAAVASRNFAHAGVAAMIEQRVGLAGDVLAQLEGPFDLVFIDADKPNNPLYLEWALKLARIGTVIVGDNVVRGGAVVDADSTDANVRGVRRFMDMLSVEPRLDSTAMQTVGEKGWDGFSISVVRS
ncbi:MAG TPA: O-methyltransferase [Burkholderiaceae bacterium]